MTTRDTSALLLADDPVWVGAATLAARAARRDCVRARTPADAMALLAGAHRFSHLMIEPVAAGGEMPTLVAMACGEAESGVDLVVLGAGSANCHAHEVARPDPAAIGRALQLPPGACRAPDAASMGQDELSLLMGSGSVLIRLQPLARLADRGIMGFEALARLKTSACGTLAPRRFVPSIEELGLAATLMRAVARAAFAAWPLLDGAALALNLPLDVLTAPETAPALDRMRAEAGLPCNQVIIELTETQRVLDGPALLTALKVWRAAGYHLAIDDAGPDLPNHRALFRLPFDYVKLDKSVVRSALLSAAARTYLSRTVAVAHGQGLSVIAEGVEDGAAWDMLQDLGVDIAQGFMIGRPLPLGAVPAWRAAWGAGSIGRA